MRVKLILPALTEAHSSFFRPIKYSLFPPLGLATLAAYLAPADEVTLTDEHVEPVALDDEPELVAIEAYVTSAHRAYALADHYRARGAHVCLGGLHPTARPDEAARHADTVFLGPGEDTWPAFLDDFRAGRAAPRYLSSVRTLEGAPRPRRDLLRRDRYLCPNTLVVSRGCVHRCEFCYKESFFRGGRSFYTLAVDEALSQVEALPGQHLFFLDDNLFAAPAFAESLFEGMRGLGRLWQGAATVEAVLRPGLLERAVEAGLRSLFIGFETLSESSLRQVGKTHNLGHSYEAAIRRLHDMGVMINASFVFGFDGDGPDVFDRTVDWAVGQGLETATFHILTPYPGTPLHERLEAQGRITSRDWDRYDTRHTVYEPVGLSAEQLEAGYWRAYERFYSWRGILRSAGTKPALPDRLRHVLYSGGWKKFEPLWDLVVRHGRLGRMVPLLESILAGFGRYGADARAESSSACRPRRAERGPAARRLGGPNGAGDECAGPRPVGPTVGGTDGGAAALRRCGCPRWRGR